MLSKPRLDLLMNSLKCLYNNSLVKNVPDYKNVKVSYLFHEGSTNDRKGTGNKNQTKIV